MRPDQIIAIVANALAISPAAMVHERGGRREDAFGRRVAAWALVHHAGMSLVQVAPLLGYADHSTVSKGVAKVEEKAAVDPVFAALLRAIGQRIDAEALDHGLGLAEVEDMARSMITSRQALMGAKLWELRAVADGLLALAEVARTAVDMIRSTDEEERAALAEAILDEMSAMTGEDFNTPEEGKTDGNA